MASQQQITPGAPSGTPNSGTPAGTKQRTAPDSSQMLANLNQAIKTKPQPQKESFEQKKRRILERCGCL